MRMALSAACAASCFLLLGCYTYAPATLEDVTPGMAVRFQVTSEGGEDLQAAPGAHLSGEVAGVSEGELLLLLRDRTGTGSFASVLTREVRLRPTHVSGFEASTFDRRRTAFFAGAVGALIGLSFYLVKVRDAGGSTSPRGGGVDYGWVPGSS